jgi:hypothetical protein
LECPEISEASTTHPALPRALALKIRYLATSSLTENPSNARTHPKAQIAKLKKAITQFGFVSPIIVDEHLMILAGHGRHRAALELGLPQVPTIMLQDMSEADVRAFVLADNIIADKAGYDKDILRTELQHLADVGYEIEITGLDTIEIDTLLAIDTQDTSGTDDIVALPSKDPPITRLGDFWHIGEHRLLIGDARDPRAVERLMDGKLAELVFTDPPYGCVISNNVSGLGKVTHDNFVMGAGQESLPNSPRRSSAQPSGTSRGTAGPEPSPSSARIGAPHRTCSMPRPACSRRSRTGSSG